MKPLKAILLAVLLAACGLAIAQSNILGTLLTSAARTTTTASSDVTNTSVRGAHIYINVTAYTSGNWTPVIQGKDPVTSNYYDICTGPSIASTGAFIFKIYPGMRAQDTTNVVCDDFLPRTWRINMVGTLTPVSTFSVGYLADF